MTIPEYDADGHQEKPVKKKVKFQFSIGNTSGEVCIPDVNCTPYGKRPDVDCRLCGALTPMTHTELCDTCWELETRIMQRPAIARRILESMNPRCSKCNGTGECSYCNGTGLI